MIGHDQSASSVQYFAFQQVDRHHVVVVALIELQEQLAQNADLEVGVLEVRQLIVFSSELTPDGPVYTALARCPLS